MARLEVAWLDYLCIVQALVRWPLGIRRAYIMTDQKECEHRYCFKPHSMINVMTIIFTLYVRVAAIPCESVLKRNWSWLFCGGGGRGWSCCGAPFEGNLGKHYFTEVMIFEVSHDHC